MAQPLATPQTNLLWKDIGQAANSDYLKVRTENWMIGQWRRGAGVQQMG